MIILFNQNVLILHLCQYVCLISEQNFKEESLKMRM